MSGEDRQGDRGERIASRLAGFVWDQSEAKPRSPVAAARSFKALESRLGARTSRRWTAALVLAGAAAGLALVSGFWNRARVTDRHRDALTYTVSGGGALRAAGVPTQQAEAETLLAFSDGTRIRMGRRARAHIVDVDRHGGRIALDDGEAHVQVVHRPGAEWVIQAGPFSVNVQGTAFSVAWIASESRFDLRMESGVVSVTGPLSGGVIVLRAGETLTVGLHDGEKAAPPVAPPPSEAPPPAEKGPAAEPAPGRPRSTARSSESWVDELARGHAAAIVAEAERRGIDRVLEQTSSEELAALADAARYQRNDRLARRALLAQRRRFPTKGRAAEAAFLLGRLYDETPGRSSRALDWYDRYLDESPDGRYVSESMGRKMVVLERTHRQGEAVAIAADYLRRFPAGTYAHAAAALVRAP